jgi:hypothetical protein
LINADITFKGKRVQFESFKMQKLERLADSRNETYSDSSREAY